MQGWRLVFYILAGLAGMTTALLFIFGLEPRTASRRVKLRGETGPGERRHNPIPLCSQTLLPRHLYSSIKVRQLLESWHCILSALLAIWIDERKLLLRQRQRCC